MGQMLLKSGAGNSVQSGTAITKQGNFITKWGQLFQSRAVQQTINFEVSLN